MKKARLPTKPEDKDMKRFISYLKTLKVNTKIIDKPDMNKKCPRRWDYTLLLEKENEKFSIEITKVKEKEFLKSIQWGNIVKEFQAQFGTLLQKEEYKGLKGAWIVRTPDNFGFTKGRAKTVAKKYASVVLRAIINNQAFVNIDGFQLTLARTSIEGRGMYFSTSGGGRFFDPAEEVIENLKRLLIKKDSQLGNKVGKGIIILINENHLADISGYARAFFTIKDALKLQNCDDIYLETQENNFALIYTRRFNSIWFNGKGTVSPDLEFVVPTQIWIKNTGILKQNPNRSIKILQRLLTQSKAHKIFPDSFAREEIVRFAETLIDNKKFKEALWLIEHFLEDPDPEEPEKYRGDPKFNYHQKIINGNDPHFITTVRGHLAWVIQKLTSRKNYLVRAFDCTKKLLKYKNLYVKLQALSPLIEIARRRQWLDGWGKRPYRATYKEFHRLVFDVVKLVEENPNYKAIAKRLSHVFFYYKDLSTGKAEQILDALKVSDESAGLFIYFGIFRQKHYKDQGIEFDGEKLNEKLKEIIRNKRENYNRLRASIAWHFWKILDENRDEFNTIKPYIDLFLEQPYQRDIYHNIERIIKDWIKDKPAICIPWIKILLDQILKFVHLEKKPQIQGHIWFAEEIVEASAEGNPKELPEIMKKLVNLWKEGTVIGSPKRLFESFRRVSDKNQRAEVKREFRKWYNSMKKLNPKLEKVDWRE